MTPPIPPQQMSDADLWEHFRGRGLSPDEATTHVERRRRGREGVARGAQATQRRPPGKGLTLLRNAAQAATSGAADEIVGRMMALSGDGDYAANRDLVRQQLAEARVEHPLISLVGTGAGAAVSPLTRLTGAVTQGVPSATLGGAVQGAVLGGAQGFGEGQGTAAERLPTAGLGSVVGAIAGGGLGKALKAVGPSFQRIARNVRAALGKKAPSAEVQAVTQAAQETALRAQLKRQGFPDEAVEQLVQTWRGGGKPPPAPPVLRPGETVTQVSPRGFEVTGVRATPPIPTQPTLLEMQGMGTGRTLPYYPRGGRIEQAIPPTPAAAPAAGMVPNQNQAFAEFLKGAKPQDIPERVGLLRALGVPLPQNAEAELLAYLSGTIP